MIRDACFTLPLLKSTTLFIVITSLISYLQAYVQILVMTEGGPGTSTYTISYLIFDQAFQKYNFGVASAQAVILFLFTGVLTHHVQDFGRFGGPGMKNRRIGGIILTALLFAVALITIVPFIWMFISSFAPNSEIVKVTGGLFPKPSTLANYVSIQEKFNFLRLFINSLVVAGLKTGIAIYTSAVLGYVFSKMRFRGRNLLFGVVMSTMMIPWAVTIIRSTRCSPTGVCKTPTRPSCCPA